MNRFDRQKERFTRYQPEAVRSDGLDSGYITSILEDREGFLWIGTEGGGLYHFDRDSETFSAYRHNTKRTGSLGSDMVYCLYEDHNGVLWVGTGNGLDRLEPGAEIFSHYRRITNDSYSLSSNTIRSITEDQSGLLWVATNDSGINLFNPATGRSIRYQNDPDDASSLSSNFVRSLIISRSGTIWIATYGGGLNQFDPLKEKFIHFNNAPLDPNSLSSDRLLSLYEDRSGIIWCGALIGGISKLDWGSNLFKHYKNDSSNSSTLSRNQVWAIMEDRDGYLWVGTDNGGLNRMDPKIGKFIHYRTSSTLSGSLSSNTVRALLQDSTGIIWIGTDNGLDRLDPGSDQFVHIQYDPEKNALAGENVIVALAEDHDGNIWIASYQEGIDYYDRQAQSFIHYQHDPNDPTSLNGSTIWTLYVDSKNTLWIGTSSGLDHLDSKTGVFTHYRNDGGNLNSLSDNRVMSILEDHAGMLWIGTTGGLNRFNPLTGTFGQFREKHGLPNDNIFGIQEDAQGYLWLSTNKGLSRFYPPTLKFTNYDVRDGLQSNEFNPGASYKNRNGEIFFGGVNGLTAFNPQEIKGNVYIPPVVLTSLTQNSIPVDTGLVPDAVNEVVFRWPNNYFEFEFAALNFTQPEKNQYAFQLEGFDQKWNYIRERHNGQYTNLPGGTYTLRLKGSNNDGVWNNTGASLTITVVPPIWQTRWFQWGAVLVLVLAVLAGYRIRLNSIERHNRQLALEVAERTHEIEQRQEVAEGLRDVLIRLNSNQSLEESLNFIVSQVNRLLGAEKVILFDNSGPETRCLAVFSDNDHPEEDTSRFFLHTRKPSGQTCPSEVLNQLPRLLRADGAEIISSFQNYLRRHPEMAHPSIAHIQTIIVAPIILTQEIFGGLVLMFPNKKTFVPEELDLINSFADQAALAVGNARLRLKAEELAVMSERTRLARDLHDAVTQTLFSASLIAEALPPLWKMDPREGEQLLKELRQLTRGALAEMRTLLMELRPTAVIDARLEDLLQQLAESVTGRTGLEVKLDLQVGCRLPDEVHVVFYRIAQEALTNIVKHARASQMSLSLRCSAVPNQPAGKGDMINMVLVVADNGRGFDLNDVPPDHFGLVNMQERAQAIGASLEIISQMGLGTQVRATWQGELKKHG